MENHLEQLTALQLGQRLLGFQDRQRAVEPARVDFFRDVHTMIVGQSDPRQRVGAQANISVEIDSPQHSPEKARSR